MTRPQKNQVSDIGQSEPWTADRDTDSVLVLEKALEQGGQEWVENLNIIEQHLLDIVETVGKRQPLLRANFILRRLPMYCTPYTNRNEYAVVLRAIDFSLQPPRRYSTADRNGGSNSNLGHIEVFQPKGRVKDPVVTPVNTAHGRDVQRSAREFQSIYKDIVNDSNAILSHEIFKKFASAFIRAANPDPDEDIYSDSSETDSSFTPLITEKLQLIGPHLLHDLKTNPEVERIFTLCPTAKSAEATRRYKRSATARCRISVNYMKSILTISVDDTEVTIRPCLFFERGYAKVNANLMDRIPLFHPNILNLSDGLARGCLLFPTNLETLWAIQFWPCESHLTCMYHPSSLTSRVFKIFACYCLNPGHFWETLNNCFLIGTNDSRLDSLTEHGRQHLNGDFMFSAFLFQLEKHSSVEDWAPRKFYTRLIHLFTATVDAYDKGFHSHYFTKVNILRGFWKCPVGGTPLDQEQASAMKELDDIEEYPEDGTEFGEKSVDYLDEDDDGDYGLHFDTLETTEDSSDPFPNYGPLSLTSDAIYKSVNPFEADDDDDVAVGSRSVLDSQFAKKSKSLSKMLGSNLLRRWATLGRSSGSNNERRSTRAERTRSMADITSGFAEIVAQSRREETLSQHRRASSALRDDEETSFSTQTTAANNGRRGRSYSVPSPVLDSEREMERSYSRRGGQNESIYSNILLIFQDIPPSDLFGDSSLLQDLQRGRKILESQDELISQWLQVMNEFPLPKVPCPHTFSTRQVQYIAQVIKRIGICTNSAVKVGGGGDHTEVRTAAWEISGDLLRTVLHQMRSEPGLDETFKENSKPVKRLSLKSFKMSSEDDGGSNKLPSLKKLSFKRPHADTCKGHMDPSHIVDDLDLLGESQFALEEPEIAATNRLLQWLWQLKTSNVGRLSLKARKYLEHLNRSSYCNSHFMEQLSEEKLCQAMAIRSAVAVSRIMLDDNFPAYVPLLAATKKGWMWAEMVLSLACWNSEKGFPIQASIPRVELSQGEILRDICINEGAIGSSLKAQAKGAEPDVEAVTLAFHSELATPLGWNDFEDPRRPGPFTVPILIFSSMKYFRNWEAAPGNIIQAMVRLQRFSNLQHVGAMLFHPHRKTALNEVRKLNKSSSFRTFQFDNNVMSKTFKRLASLRSTRLQLKIFPANRSDTMSSGYSTCQEVGCTMDRRQETEILFHRGSELQCTRL